VIDGSPVSLGAGQSALVGFWGQLTLERRIGRVTAPLSVLLLKRHWNLPAGTTHQRRLRSHAATVSKSRTTHGHLDRQQCHRHDPGLRVTVAIPSPGTREEAQAQAQEARATAAHGDAAARLQAVAHYVFPVDGGASVRTIRTAPTATMFYDGWHHGDDLFAPLGTPIVAVANGKLSLVG
jgi:hypothetical protein